jgi:hypothetical protein
MLVSAAFITLMYIPVFFTIRGNLLITPSRSAWFGYRFTFRSSTQSFATESSMSGSSCQSNPHHKLARRMLWYPIAYVALLLPTAICRFIGLGGIRVPLPVLLWAICMINFLGFSDACIYFFTRNLGGTARFSRPSAFKQSNMEIHVERTTVNGAGPAPRRDNVKIQDRTGRIRTISIPMHLDATKSSPHHSSFSPEEDRYSDIGAKPGVEDDGPPFSPKVCRSSQVGTSQSNPS